MRQATKALALLLVLAVGIAVTVTAGMGDKAAVYVEQAVLEKLQHEPKVRVIVMLDKEPVGKLSTAAFKANAKASERVIDQLDDFNVKYVYKSFPGFAGEISEKDLEKLKQIPGAKVYADEPKFHISLSESVPFINATKVWPVQVGGINITGAGYSVCVIDTGINASHPALAGRVVAQYDFCADNNANTCAIQDSEADDITGHGTHVSGIIASNNTNYAGVAPGANIVAMKVGPGPNLGTAAIIAAMDWCVDNKETYNISVISMSFGGGGPYNSSNTTACDIFDLGMTPAINAAYAANIFLVAASGNEAFTTGIGYPACLGNVTSVGATYDTSDNIYGNSNVGDLLDLLAPGVGITSTLKDGVNFDSSTGTSMAAPHVSGLAVLLLQYLKLKENRTLTPAEIKSRLEKTGDNVTDTRPNPDIITPRIDALSAIAPVISHESPLAQSYNKTNLHFNLSLTNSDNVWATAGNVSLDNMNFTLTNDSASHWYNITVGPERIRPGANNPVFYVLDSVSDTHISTISFTINATVNYTNPSPANGSITGLNWTYINITSPVSLNASFVRLENSTAVVNYSMPMNNGSATNWYLNVTNLASDTYGFWVYGNDSSNDWYVTNITNLIVDTTPPNILLLSPQNASSFGAGQVIQLNFTDNVQINTTWYKFNSTNYTLPASYNISTENWTKALWNLTAYANDSVGNLNSSIFVFNVTNTLPVWNWANAFLTVNEDSAIIINASGNASDLDGDVLAFSVTNLPSGAAINSTTGIFNWTPPDANVGNNTLTFKASDSASYKESNITIQVSNTNDAPTITAIANQAATVGQQFSLQVVASDADSDSGDSLSFSDNTTLFDINNATGLIQFTPNSNLVGSHSIEVTAIDLAGLNGSATFKLTISEPSVGGGSSGGISSGASEVTRTWGLILNASPAEWKISNAAIAVDQIVIDANRDLENITTKIKSASKPANAPAVNGTAYQYFNITATNLHTAMVDKIIISFNVPKSWLAVNQIDKSNIWLARWTGSSWQNLLTYLLNETATMNRYAAETKQFSVFAIAGIKTPVTQVQENLTTAQAGNITTTMETANSAPLDGAAAAQPSAIPALTKEEPNFIALLIAAGIAAVLVIFMHSIKPRSRLKSAPPVQRPALVQRTKRRVAQQPRPRREEPDFGFG